MKPATFALLALAVSACAEPVVELSFRLPSADKGGDFNTSCVTAVDVFTNGTTYPATEGDYVRSCVQLSSSPDTFSELRSALAGKIDVQIPESGLGSVEVFARKGTCTVDASVPIGDLVFYAGAKYADADQLVLPIDAIASCDQAPVVVRPIDILKLTTGTTKGDCAAAKAVDGPNSGADIGTMTPTVASGVLYYNGLSGASLTGGVANVPGASMTIGPKSCLAVSSGDDAFGSLSCVDRNAPPVCANAGELEAPGIAYGFDIASLDQAKKNRFPGVVYGAVVGQNKLPIQGATVEVDPKHGEVVYVEPGTGRLVPTGGTATGPSGLFMVYADSLVSVKVSSGVLSRTVTMGAISDAPAAALVLLR